jgi:hypothetical protein
MAASRIFSPETLRFLSFRRAIILLQVNAGRIMWLFGELIRRRDQGMLKSGKRL